MLERPVAEPAALPALSPVQFAFLLSLVPGPRPTSHCQDAITVGNLMRLNLVAWLETEDQFRVRNDTFSLTPLAVQFLANHHNPDRVEQR